MGIFDFFKKRTSRQPAGAIATSKLPPLVPLLRWVPPPVGVYPKTGLIASVDELPSRLFLGNRRADSFVKNAEDWKCVYHGIEPETFTELSGEDGRLKLRHSFRGHDDFRSYAATWQGLWQVVLGIPKSWNEELDRTLSGTWNLTFVPYPDPRSSEDTTFSVSVPDGYEFTLVQPIHFTAIGPALEALEEAVDSGSIGAACFAYARLSSSSVSYPFGDGMPAFTGSPEDLFEETVRMTGLPPTLPKIEQGEDGTEAVTLTRTHYNLVVGCFLRDVIQVVEALAEAEIVGRAESGQRSGVVADEPEQRGMVISGSPYIGKTTLTWSNSERTRSVYHELSYDVAEMGELLNKLDEPFARNLPTFQGVVRTVNQAITEMKEALRNHDDGELYEKGTYKDDKREGPLESYHENGQLHVKVRYKDGKINGPFEIYYETGQLWEKGTYKDDKREGPLESYYENGRLMWKVAYKDGENDGPFENYYDNGELMETGTFKDGKRDGPSKSYHSNGQLEAKGTYRMDERCGEWIEDGETVTYDPCPPRRQLAPR